MNIHSRKRRLRSVRKTRIRSKVSGSASRPRMSVFRSNKVLSVQLIDDEKHVTLLSASAKGKNKNAAKELGDTIAKFALKSGISTVVFDRGGYRYHGTIKELADAARSGGLKF